MSTTSFSRSSSSRRLRANASGRFDATMKQVQTIRRAAGAIVNELGGGPVLSLRDTLDSMGLRNLPMPSLARARACGLPECHCASPDLGEVRKVVDRPERVSLAVRFRNTSERRRTFELQPGALISEAGEPGGALEVAVPTLDLDPAEVGVVQVLVDASEHRRGVDYVGAIKVTSKDCEDMFLTVAVLVESEVETVPIVDLHCCCHPHVRPLRWYHHYYCDPPRADRNPNTPDDHHG